MKLNLSEKLKTGLTPQEKIDCYEQAIAKLQKRSYDKDGICFCLHFQFDGAHDLPYRKSYKYVHELFPELMNHKPVYLEVQSWWFSSTEERIEVLNKLIEEQKKLL